MHPSHACMRIQRDANHPAEIQLAPLRLALMKAANGLVTIYCFNLHASGGTIKLDHLGPVIGERSIPACIGRNSPAIHQTLVDSLCSVSEDGTLRRITNWATLTALEKEVAFRRISSRNKVGGLTIHSSHCGCIYLCFFIVTAPLPWRQLQERLDSLTLTNQDSQTASADPQDLDGRHAEL